MLCKSGFSSRLTSLDVCVHNVFILNFLKKFMYNCWSIFEILFVKLKFKYRSAIKIVFASRKVIIMDQVEMWL